VAVTLVDWDELHRWKTVSDDLVLDMPEAPETYSTSAHLYTDLDIPADATGRLPLAKRTRAGLAAEYVDTEGDKGGRRRGDRTTRGRRSAEATDPAPRARRTRTRTRSRGGVALNADGTPVDAALTGVTTDAPPTAGPAADTGDDDTKSRRRRRRGGARKRRSSADEPAADAPAPDAAAS
jgi:hypothetical protein